MFCTACRPHVHACTINNAIRNIYSKPFLFVPVATPLVDTAMLYLATGATAKTFFVCNYS